MSDTMLFGVLKMPFEMAMNDEISRRQFYQRVQELVARVEAQLKQEPVAEITVKNWHWIETTGFADKTLPDGLHKLYATPPAAQPEQRKPLTEEMRKQMLEVSDNYERRGAFANGWLSAEAAHNIKEET
jgi:broad specificity phosphatase PhoE